MGKVNTVLGQIENTQMGVTYCHEHLYTSPPPPVPDIDPDLVVDDFEDSIFEMQNFVRAGGGTLVEMTTRDYGRNVHLLRKVASTINSNIIVPTGFLKGEYHAPLVADKSINQLADEMIQDITTGIDGTDSKAGVIKGGSGFNLISKAEEKVFQAVALAQKNTGVPISTHTEAGTMGFEQVDILLQEGVKPDRIIIGHLDRNMDFDYHLSLARRGVYVMYDNISKEAYAPDKLRISFILDLIKLGFGKQILLSGDMGRKKYFTRRGGGPGYTYILWRFIPWLKWSGASDEQIEDILINNPQTAFEIR